MESQSPQNLPAFWGQYGDLYNTLDTSQVELLERAVLARRLGRFDEAWDIHNKKLPQARLVPVLALEKSNLASRLGLPGQQHAILEEALNSSNEWPQPNSEKEIALLQISIAEARFQWKGCIKVVLHEARVLRNQWKWLDPRTWTDVEIAFITKYFAIMRSFQRLSNWVDLNTDAMFLAAEKAGPWSGLKSVIRVAKEHGNLFACTELINLYTEIIDKDEKLIVFSEFIHECEVDSAHNTRHSSLVLVYLRLWFADMLHDLSEDQRSSEELTKVHNKLLAFPWILETDTPNLMLRKLLMPSHEKLLERGQKLNYFELATQLSDLAITVNTCGDRLLETQLLARAMTALNQINHSQRQRVWYDLNEELVARYSNLHNNDLTRVVLRASRVSTLANTLGAIEDQSKLREYLQELDRFQQLYPDFDVPTTLRDLYRGAAVSLTRLGNKDEARAFETKTVSALHDCPTDPSQFYRIYRGKPFGEWSRYLLGIILPWIKADLAAAKLSADQVALMLNITLPEANPEVAVHRDQVLDALDKPGEAFVGQIFGYPLPVSCESWELRLSRFETWLWDSPSHVDRYIRHTILGDLQQARCASMHNYVLQVTNRSLGLLDKDIARITPDDIAAVYDEDLEMNVRVMKSTENMRLVNLRKRLDRRAMGADDESAFGDGWTLMCERSQLATSFKAFRNGLIQDRDLAEAQTWFEQAYSRLNNNNPARKMATLQQIASCQLQRYVMFGALASDASLNTHEMYDQVYSEQRVARSILRGAESVTARSEILARWSFTNHYDFAMGACVEAIGAGQRRNAYHRHIHQDLQYMPAATPSSTRTTKELFTCLIDWAQRKKARSVTEALGAEMIVPRNLLLDAGSQSDALTLLTREAELQNEINNADGDVLELSRALDRLRQEMRECPGLKKIMELRDGQALTESQIQLLASELGEDVIIVDFVYLPTAFTALLGEIIPMVYKKGRLVSASFVTPELRHTRIKTWIEAFLEQEEPLSEDEPVLKLLYPLIEAGVKFSNPGDTVVLCPTDILFNIPLHAIELPDGMPWIQRNPIVYTQALSVLRLCHYSASAREPQSKTKSLAVQALSKNDMQRPGAAKMEFAERCNTQLLQGEALTKKSFLTACAKSELIHFYGHVSFDPTRPLDQFLAIRDLETEKITVRDLFDIRLRPGTHVNLIGCQSGRSKVGINDDQLGLSTALFFAGAASMVTTLWSIEMADGTAFQESFFDELLARRSMYTTTTAATDVGEGEGGRSSDSRSFIDLAKAFQAAVLRISIDPRTEERKAPYHWAAFTLQGCWNRFPSSLLLQSSDGDKVDNSRSDRPRSRSEMGKIARAIAKLDVKWT